MQPLLSEIRRRDTQYQHSFGRGLSQLKDNSCLKSEANSFESRVKRKISDLNADGKIDQAKRSCERIISSIKLKEREFDDINRNLLKLKDMNPERIGEYGIKMGILARNMEDHLNRKRDEIVREGDSFLNSIRTTSSLPREIRSLISDMDREHDGIARKIEEALREQNRQSKSVEQHGTKHSWSR